MAEQRGWLWTSLAGGTLSYAWASYGMPVLAPLLVPIVTVMLGWAHYDFMTLWVAGWISFAAAALGLLRFAEWKDASPISCVLS